MQILRWAFLYMREGDDSWQISHSTFANEDEATQGAIRAVNAAASDYLYKICVVVPVTIETELDVGDFPLGGTLEEVCDYSAERSFHLIMYQGQRTGVF